MRKIITITFIWFFIFPNLTFAGEYVLVKGKGVEVCEEYGKNLNFFSPKVPMEYEREINPAFKDFTKPEWEMYFGASNELFDKVDLFLWERDANPSYHNFVVKGKKQHKEAWKRYKADRQASSSLGLPVTIVDIDNDGKIENVSFGGRTGGYRILLVLNDDKTDIDLKKTSLLIQHPSLPVNVESHIYDNVHYGVFVFKNVTYFDFWKASGPVSGELRVFITEKQKTQELCTYQFKFE